MDGWMDGIYLPDHGQEHTSTNLKVLAWEFFFFWSFLTWYGYGYGYGIWFWLWVGQKIYDMGQGWNIYIMRKGEGGRMLKVHTYLLVFKKAF